MHIPTISRSFVLQVVEALNQVPPSVSDLVDTLTRQEKVSIAEYIHLVKQIQQETSDEMLGLLDSPVPLGSFSTLCHMLVHCPDLLTALNNYRNFYGLFSNSYPLSFSLGQNLTFEIDPSSRAATQPYYVHTLLLGVVKLMCWLTGQKILPTQVVLAVQDERFSSELEYLFGVKPNCHGVSNSMTFDAEVLRFPVSPKIPVEEYTQNRNTYLLVWAVAEDLERQVYALVSDGIDRGHFNVERLASDLNISRHTLNRRLVSAGTTYREILSKVRRDRALKLLKDGVLSIDQIADSLGYSDARSFSRAFSGWYGLTPSQYLKS